VVWVSFSLMVILLAIVVLSLGGGCFVWFVWWFLGL
jgi:hypothetical protein